MTEEDAIKIVDKAVNDLREFFPHVQILATWEDEEDGSGNTYDIFRGKGNWYARAGMASEFLNRDSGQTFSKEIAEQIKPPDDDNI